MIREIDVAVLRDAVARLFIKANKILPQSISQRLEACIETEKSPLCRGVLSDLVKNAEEAKRLNIPVCQDTGMAVVFLEIGQEVHFTGGNLNAAVNEGVAKGCKEGYLRASVVSDPLVNRRVNTNDNTPAVIHISVVDGDKAKVTVAPKGFGSENMSALKMFAPSASVEEIIGFVTETVSVAGSNPCPPVIVGVGLGGDFELSALLAKKALCRDISVRHPDKRYAELEARMLDDINRLGIGAQGFGGTVTALGVNIETYPTHIAGLPVAVNMGCHVTRHCEEII